MRILSAMLLVMAMAAPAFADATAEAKKHSEAFGKACGDGDLKAVMALYTDDAYVVWPGAGEEAHGKAAIEKLVPNLCDPKGPKPVLKSVVGVQLDPTRIATIGHWELTQNGPDGKPATTDIRTSEIIVKSGNGWRYLVDHASVGVPPPPNAK